MNNNYFKKNINNLSSLLSYVFKDTPCKFNLNMNDYTAFLSLSIIGVLRNYLEIAFGIHLTTKWYSCDSDIVFVMMFFPPFFAYFGPMIIHITFRFLKINIEHKKIFFILFYTQLLHLIVPMLDFIGQKLKIPYKYDFVPIFHNDFFTSQLVATSGILFVWIISSMLLLFIFIRRFNIPIKKALITGIIIFNILYWPIYHFWISMNTLFLFLTGIDTVSYANNYGYGLFFMFCSISGYFYAKKERKNTDSKNV